MSDDIRVPLKDWRIALKPEVIAAGLHPRGRPREGRSAMNCVHCNAPGAHLGTQKCTDLHACHGRQEYARGVADERARAVANLRAGAEQCRAAGESLVGGYAEGLAERFERGEHEEKS